MSVKRMISVLDATGVQGGAVAHALLTDGTFQVRAITRKASSAEARALTRLGADVVEATLDDPVSLRKAFEGADGAFLVTPESDYDSVETAMTDVERLIAALDATEVPNLYWSTLLHEPKSIGPAVLHAFQQLLQGD